MKVWISKYTLSTGIFESEGEICHNIDNNMIKIQAEPYCNPYYHKPDWHETKESAIEQAEKMRVKKIESLKKQIDKLEKMTFEL